MANKANDLGLIDILAIFINQKRAKVKELENIGNK